MSVLFAARLVWELLRSVGALVAVVSRIGEVCDVLALDSLTRSVEERLLLGLELERKLVLTNVGQVLFQYTRIEDDREKNVQREQKNRWNEKLV